MIRDRALWEQWEAEQLKAPPADFVHTLRLVEAMYREAQALGVVWARDEGLDVKLTVARVLNVCRAAGTPRAGA